MMDKNKIYRTTNYKLFKRLNGNRPVTDERHVKKLMSSIARIGLANPILVNENFEVLDGQHRLEACIRLGVPVRFTVAEQEILVEDLANMQGTQKSWVLTDYIASEVERGSGTHKWIQTMFKDHSSLSKSTITRIIGITLRNVNGFYLDLRERSIIERKLEFLDEVSEDLKVLGGRASSVADAVLFMYDMPAIDNDRLKIILKRAKVDWVKTSDIQGALSQLEKHYNHYSKTKVSVVIPFQISQNDKYKKAKASKKDENVRVFKS